MTESFANSRFNHEDYQLKPQHRILEQHIMINDALPNRILSGTVIVKGNIERFTENGVIFEGDYKKFIQFSVSFSRLEKRSLSNYIKGKIEKIFSKVLIHFSAIFYQKFNYSQKLIDIRKQFIH